MEIEKNMKRVVLLASSALLFAGVSFGYTIEAKSGDDLVQVRDKVRVAREVGGIREGEPVTVLLSPGIYRFEGSLTLGPKDAGSSRGVVTWRAKRPGTVRFQGGVNVPAEAWKHISDATIRERFPEAARNRILEADLSSLLPGELGPWPDSYKGRPPAPWLYQNGEMQDIAGWPNGCWSSFTNVVDNGLTDDPKNEIAVRPGIFYLEGAPNAARWRIEDGVWTDGYWIHDWLEETIRLASYDSESQIAKHATIHYYGLLGKGTCGRKSRRFRVLNVPEELDDPGEWWLDRKKKRLYCLPKDKKDLSGYVLAADIPTFLKFEQTAWMAFENIDFVYSHGASGAIAVGAKSHHVMIRNCRFSNFGGTAVEIKGHDCVVSGCKISHTGDSAVVIGGGDRKNLVNGRNVLTKTEISNYGRFRRVALGVNLCGCGNAITSCEIHHGGAGAINYSGNEHLIAFNNIHHVICETCDAGAVYTGNDTSTQGNLLFGNYTHELDADPKLLHCRNGFYFDDCDWGDVCIGNRFWRTGPALFIGGGNMHPLYNNLVCDAWSGVHIDDRGLTWERRYKGSFLADAAGKSWAEQKLLQFDYRAAPWHVAYPEAADVVDDRPRLAHANPIVGNKFVNCRQAFDIGKWAWAVRDKMPIRGNEVVSNCTDIAGLAVPQPISLREAERTRIDSPNGRIVAAFGLDVAGRLTWAMRVDGKEVVSPSSLGVTIGYRDYGKLVVPAAAKMKNGTEKPLLNILNESDDPVSCTAERYCEAVVPMRDLVTGRECAFLQVRAFDGGLAFRWRVPGEGRRKVYGEMTTWAMVRSDAVVICDADRGESPRYRLQSRGEGVRGLVFPDAPRGWWTEGEVITPWRVTFVKGL